MAMKRANPYAGKQKPVLKRQNASNLNQVQLVQRRIAASEEHKEISLLTVADVTLATTSVVTLRNGCAQGTSAVTRAGRRTTMTSLTYLWQVSFAATTVGAAPLRLLIVYDRQPNGAAPAALDVVLTDTITSPMNLNNSRRFKVLVDETTDGISDAGPKSYMVKGYRTFTKKKEGGWPCEFKDTSSGTITDITTGSIYSLVWQGGNLITAAPQNALYTRIRFTDA